MKKEIIERTGSLISDTAYNRAREMYNDWIERQQNYDSDDCICPLAKDYPPPFDQIRENVWSELVYVKLDYYPENILGDEYGDEELDCYNKMAEDDVTEFIEKGLERFESGFRHFFS